MTAFLPPIPQPQAYHQFADQRTVFGVPHAWDVLSNVAFLISGLLGLLFLAQASALDAGTRWAFAVLFLGLLLTSIGSGYYHLAPDNARLVFDRLPMIVAMAGCLGAVITDRFGETKAWWLAGLMAIGFWSVHQWSVSEQQGRGDLRWYALYEGLIIVTGVLLLLLFPSRNGATKVFAIALIGNVAAKAFELFDKPIYAFGGVVSGHTLKHLSAGLAFLPLAFFICGSARKYQCIKQMQIRLRQWLRVSAFAETTDKNSLLSFCRFLLCCFYAVERLLRPYLQRSMARCACHDVA
jgi:hypothetical protein